MLLRRVLTVIIFLLIGNAAVRMGFLILHDQKFKDAVNEVALFAGQGNKSDELLKQLVMEKANENQIPLDPNYIELWHTNYQGGDKVNIKCAWAINVSLFPGYMRRFDFTYQTP